MKGIIKKIDSIQFGLMSPEQIREMSVVKIERPDTYDEDGYPIEAGLMDARMGVIDPSLKCHTCGEKGGECQGHFGMIELARPVIHVGFGDDIHKILRSTCSECGRVLLDDDEIKYYKERMDNLLQAGKSVDELVKEIYRKCKDKKSFSSFRESSGICPHCGAEQEDIKIIKPIDIIEVRKQYDEEGNIIIDSDGYPITEDYELTPSEVREKLQRIPDEDAYVLGVNPEVTRPEWMVLSVLPVPPVPIRPTIALDTGETSEDDLTHKLVDVLRINQRLIENMDAGAPQLIVEDLWKLLQYHVTTYFDNEASGVPPARHRSGRPFRTLAQRLKGKEGRFRSNLAGKRVNFTARTVISPDPNISINEVGVPEMIAKEVTVPTSVNEWNIKELKEAILNGPNVHPGANYVKKTINGKEFKVRVLDDNKELVVENLEYGDVVVRHLKDGDIVLLNRQPSLHRMSIMAHEVKVLPYKTLRLNLCVCPPYNADFDGDEMNMHIPQTVEARAEAKSLMLVQENILSPRFGGPIIGAIHDHLSGAYLLTREGSEFPEEEVYQLLRKSNLLNYPYESCFTYDTPKEYKTEVLHNYKLKLKRKNRNWTGKEIFSLLLPDDLNMSYRAKTCRRCETCDKKNCKYDSFVVIKDGQLTHGAIDKKAYGSFSGQILDTIVKDYGPSYAKEFLDCSSKLAIGAITNIGFTTSLNDFEIPEEAIEVIDAHLDQAERAVDILIDAYVEGLLVPLPGRSAEETLEHRIVQVLGEARDVAGEIAEFYFTMGKESLDDSMDYVAAIENHAVVAARTGARASMLNLAQITACVGQQSVRGRRITRGYLARSLPHFRKHELGARAKGFVHSSYKEGLDPIEFFFHAIGGREGLVNTAVRTIQSGYMQRRLTNALQDLNVRSDGLVTDNKGQVIQSVFGEEGIDPAKSDYGNVANLDRIIDEMRIKNNNSYKDDEDDYSFEDEPDIKKPVESKEDKLVESKTRGYGKSYNKTEKFIGSDIKKPVESKEDKLLESKTRIYRKSYLETEKMINFTHIIYDSINDDLFELNNNLEKFEIKINKRLDLETNHLNKNINIIHSNLDDIASEYANIHFSRKIWDDRLSSLKGKNYEFTSIDEVDAEMSKLNSVSYELPFDKIERVFMKLDEEISSFDSVIETFESLLDFQKKKITLMESLKSKRNVITSKLKGNSNSFLAGIDKKITDINEFDKEFYYNNYYEIEELLGKFTDLFNDYSFYLGLANNIKMCLDEKIKFLDNVEDPKDLNEEITSINSLLNDEDETIDFIKIRQDYEEQIPKYNNLKSLELEFREKKSEQEKFKENYSELYEMGFNYNDVNEDILHNYSKFKEFSSGIDFKYKLVSFDLSDNDVTAINQNIINDILNQEINNENFSSIYDEYANRYLVENSSFISDEEFEENYKELYDLGFKSKDVSEENLEIYNKFKDEIDKPALKLKIKLSSFVSNENIDIIKKKIIEDIINNVLVGDLDYLSLFETYSKRIEDSEEKNIDWELFINQIDLSRYDDETIDFCKETVENEYRSNVITQNDIEVKFKFYLNKKFLEKRNLHELNLIINDSVEPKIKQFLTEKEQEMIYRVTKTEICGDGINGSVYDYVEREMIKRIDDNRSDARKALRRFTQNKENFINNTGLNENQMYDYIEEVYDLIHQDKIRDDNITSEFIIKTTKQYAEYGRIEFN